MSARPNFGRSEDDNKRCATCATVAYDENKAAYCMAEAAGASNATAGHRVNENFVCDSFKAK